MDLALDILLQDFVLESREVPSVTAGHPGPEAAKQPQTITLPPPRLTVDVLFPEKYQASFILTSKGSTSRQSRQPTECYLKSLGDHEDENFNKFSKLKNYF
ncbi:hypothetical protein CRENBAI_023829 [Crenichthys baileyi]|uniref:Uncharacterized protein n=1 Tax=Crenichthys baileyi TaxID=28760 RepID=A0AAV9RW81_9TELE